ncbi:aminodeoxychorismate synthase component I [Hyphomicrobium sulfonivorans]|uniref:aminodeoxychorismate synthase component I n=1 Tax=Hyphomicrobium sulfonivorans TaxID=121290 RepID=UPI0015710DBC|nr:aminodeoxychorismate synthase component I [Hyphomicrobium sulfonivorans]MBI1649391.1 aminodeoxychorismate synthase component I [Hyphomicrobium sulfonivorans]NSL71308.1 aminodeoxychorismate synthase component I [Hyphomicrobium sulfonivorans]
MTAQKPRSGQGQPTEEAAALSQTFVLLDNNSGSGPPSLLFSEPLDIISASTPEEVPAALARIEAGVASGLHAAGFFAYELGYALEPKLAPLMPQQRNVPLLWIGLYRAPQQMTSAEVEHWLATHTRSGSFHFDDVKLAWNEQQYVERFDQVIEKIRAGDIYQLNLTFKARFKLSGSPLTFFLDLRQKQRVAYGGIVDTGEMTVLSASPELFIEQEGRTVFTRPMKGTAPRAGTEEADAQAKLQLAGDVKQRAENLMIVDLMRNDIGRIAEVGSVEVTDLFTVETYKTLHQMTSGVRATLQEGIDINALMRGIFPPGSVIGAPKIRAMELIRELETEPRGVYCGAIGYISPEGRSLFNVAIRTAVIFRNADGEMGIGSGVVYDSQGPKEYAECLLKMKFLTDPVKRFELIETLLYDPAEGGFVLLERHLERLAKSASYFAYVHDEAAAREALDRAVEDAGSDKRLRVRLLLTEDGEVSVTTTPLAAAAPDATMRFAVSSSRVDSNDLFLFHKTTRRELYDREWQEYADKLGTDEVIYLNERGEIAEGSRMSVFIERDGTLLTPPLSAGLLPGTLRAELLAAGKAREAVLTLADLETADAVYLGNSVRGLLRAVRV